MKTHAGPPVPADSASCGLNPKELALWLFQQFAPDAGVLNVPVAIRLPGPARWWPLQMAVSQLLARHPALRTVFPAVDGLATREVLNPDDPRAAVDIETFPTTPESLDDDLRCFAAPPFDLTARPPIRIGHFTGCPDGDVVSVVVQHIAFDSASATTLVGELLELYRAFAAGDPVPEHLAATVPPYVEPAAAEESIGYWREVLAGADELGGELALGRTPQAGAGFTGGRLCRELPPDALLAMRNISADLRITQNLVLLCVYMVLLSRHGAGHDLVVGMPVDTRDRSARSAIGYHINVLGIRTRLPTQASFRDFTSHARGEFLTALRHCAASLDEVFPGGYDSGDGWHRPVFRYFFNYLPEAAPLPPGVAAVPVHTGYSRLDLSLVAVPRADGLTLELFYRDEIFNADEGNALLRRFEALLLEVARRPDAPLGELDMWSADDRAIVAAARANQSGPGTPAVVDPGGRELPPGLPGELCYLLPDAKVPRRTGATAQWTLDGRLRRLDVDTPAETEQAHDEPADEDLTAVVVELWRDVLAVPDLDAGAHFFRSGGTSVLAATLVARIRAVTQAKVSLRQVFSAPTPAQLAAVIRASLDSTGANDDRRRTR